jgi:hypothetical protein
VEWVIVVFATYVVADVGDMVAGLFLPMVYGRNIEAGTGMK